MTPITRARLCSRAAWPSRSVSGPGTTLGGRPRARILIEASTESGWVARYLEGLGREVVVADPNFAPMYATRSRRVKTDKRDARTLAEARRLGAYRPAHRASDRRRRNRAQLLVRTTLVRTRFEVHLSDRLAGTP